MKIFLASSLCILLAACSLSGGNNVSADVMTEYCDTQQGYCFSHPKQMDKIIGENDVPVVTTTLDTPHELGFSIQPYYLSSLCSPYTLCTEPNNEEAVHPCGCTVAEPIVLEESEDTFTVIGKFAGYRCSVDKCDDSKYGMDQYKGRYVLYSSHDSKTVKIEINQITDNPALAGAILKTFKWTE